MRAREYDYAKEPTISIVKSILSEAVKLRVSDIHFDPTPETLVVRFRIDGDLIEFTTAPNEAKKNILTRIKILASMNITETNVPQTGTIKYEDKQSSHNMLVSSLPTINGEKIVIHIADYHQSLNGIDSLLFSEDNLVKLKRLINLPNGIILICGSTSAGKTTTMYSLLKELDTKAKNIITVEDPVKMRIEGINQVEVAPEKGLTMSSILRSLLVQDPNVICLSEINNEEIARLALRASTTGRIVISTVHSKNASTTVDMLSNMNIETYLLASTLSGIISQRLVKKLCPKCRRQKEANTFEKTIFRRALNKNINILYEPVGCNECIDGYQGRLPIAEVVEINNEMRTAIANHKDSDTLYNILYKDTNTILQDGLIMAMNGDTSFEEIMRVVDYESDFNKDNEAIKKTILGAASETMKESQKEVEQPIQEVNIVEPVPVTEPQLVEEVVPTPAPIEVAPVPTTEIPVAEPTPIVEAPAPIQEPTPVVETPVVTEPTPVVEEPTPVVETPAPVQEPVVEEPKVETPVTEPKAEEKKYLKLKRLYGDDNNNFRNNSKKQYGRDKKNINFKALSELEWAWNIIKKTRQLNQSKDKTSRTKESDYKYCLLLLCAQVMKGDGKQMVCELDKVKETIRRYYKTKKQQIDALQNFKEILSKDYDLKNVYQTVNRCLNPVAKTDIIMELLAIAYSDDVFSTVFNGRGEPG